MTAFIIEDLGLKIDRLRAFGDPKRIGHSAQEWAKLCAEYSLAYGLFEGIEVDLKKLEPERLGPLFARMRKGGRGIQQEQLRRLASRAMFDLEHDFGADAWRMFVDLAEPEFTGELKRKGYGLFGRPYGNPFVDPAGPLAWLAPFKWQDGGLDVHLLPPLRTQAGGPERFGVPRLGPRREIPAGSHLQVEVPLAAPRFVLLLAVFPPTPERRAMCLSPSQLVPNEHFEPPAALLPIVPTAGLRAFQVPGLTGEYLLIGLLTARQLGCAWLRHAVTGFYVPDLGDLASLQRELEAHDPAQVEVRYRTVEVVVSTNTTNHAPRHGAT